MIHTCMCKHVPPYYQALTTTQFFFITFRIMIARPWGFFKCITLYDGVHNVTNILVWYSEAAGSTLRSSQHEKRSSHGIDKGTTWCIFTHSEYCQKFGSVAECWKEPQYYCGTPLYRHPLNTDTQLLRTVLFVPTKSSYIFSKIVKPT